MQCQHGDDECRLSELPLLLPLLPVLVLQPPPLLMPLPPPHGPGRTCSGASPASPPLSSADRVINCAQDLHPEQEDWLPLVACLQATSPKRMPGAVERCAEGAGLEAGPILACADGARGDALEAAAAKETAGLCPEHTCVCDGLVQWEVWDRACALQPNQAAHAGGRHTLTLPASPPPQLRALAGGQRHPPG